MICLRSIVFETPIIEKITLGSSGLAMRLPAIASLAFCASRRENRAGLRPSCRSQKCKRGFAGDGKKLVAGGADPACPPKPWRRGDRPQRGRLQRSAVPRSLITKTRFGPDRKKPWPRCSGERQRADIRSRIHSLRSRPQISGCFLGENGEEHAPTEARLNPPVSPARRRAPPPFLPAGHRGRMVQNAHGSSI